MSRKFLANHLSATINVCEKEAMATVDAALAALVATLHVDQRLLYGGSAKIKVRKTNAVTDANGQNDKMKVRVIL